MLEKIEQRDLHVDTAGVLLHVETQAMIAVRCEWESDPFGRYHQRIVAGQDDVARYIPIFTQVQYTSVDDDPFLLPLEFGPPFPEQLLSVVLYRVRCPSELLDRPRDTKSAFIVLCEDLQCPYSCFKIRLYVV